MAKGDAEMALAQADVGDEDDIGLVLDEAQAEEILNLRPVDLLRPAPVELIDGLEYRKAGERDPAQDTAVFAVVGLAFDQARQILDVRPLLGASRLTFIVISY